VRGHLESKVPDVEVVYVIVETIGDKRTDVPLAEISGRGVFTTEVDQAVLDGRADVAVHSAKDLPAAVSVPGLVLAAVPERADVRDALVGRALSELPLGGIVATGAPRRRVQLAHVRPDLVFSEVRGNIGTRLARVPDGGALVVALAALDRLELTDTAVEVLSVETMLPQVGQGAIALRCRADDDETLGMLEMIDDLEVHRAVLAERAFLACLGGGCEAPVGAYATLAADGIHLEAMLASLDGTQVIRRRALGADPLALGTALAEEMLEIDGAGELFGPT
jgi:hydroxymethylbilane synthase